MNDSELAQYRDLRQDSGYLDIYSLARSHTVYGGFSTYLQIRRAPTGRLQTVKVGVLCPVCGFHPNKTAKDMTRQALEACER